MNGEEFLATLREERGTQLDRLGSEKALVAWTDATLESEPVLLAAAGTVARAVDTYETWAEDEADERARAAFADVAARERNRYERILDATDGPAADPSGDPSPDPSADPSADPSVNPSADPSPDPSADQFAAASADPVYDYLGRLEGTVERVAAGLVGRPLVDSRTFLQVVNFFLNEGDTGKTELFREIRGEIDDLVEEGATLLNGVSDTDRDTGDWERAREAADETIRLAYREYADTLEGMGLDPKPVC